MEPVGSLPHSQVPATRPYPKLRQIVTNSMEQSPS